MTTPLHFSVVAMTDLSAFDKKGARRHLVSVSNDRPSVVTTVSFSRPWTLAEAAAAILKLRADTDLANISRLIIGRDHTLTSDKQAMQMIGVTAYGALTGMRTDGQSNLFFLKAKGAIGLVSVGSIDRREGEWYLHDKGGLDNPYRWDAECRLFLRTFDPSKFQA